LDTEHVDPPSLIGLSLAMRKSRDPRAAQIRAGKNGKLPAFRRVV
jgi:hypothetical protein